MYRRLLSENTIDHLTTRAGAGQHGLMNLCLHDPDQLAQMPDGRVKLRLGISRWITRHQFADARHHGAYLGKPADGLVRPLGKIDDLLAIEEPFDKPVQFLETNEAISAQIGRGRFRGHAG